MARTRNPKLDPDGTAIVVRLQNGELFISCVDGWNDNDEILMYGPLFSESRRHWYVNSELIVGYVERMTDTEKAEAANAGFRNPV